MKCFKISIFLVFYYSFNFTLCKFQSGFFKRLDVLKNNRIFPPEELILNSFSHNVIISSCQPEHYRAGKETGVADQIVSVAIRNSKYGNPKPGKDISRYCGRIIPYNNRKFGAYRQLKDTLCSMVDKYDFSFNGSGNRT